MRRRRIAAIRLSRGGKSGIGEGIRVTRHGMDLNGNHCVWVSYRRGRSTAFFAVAVLVAPDPFVT